MVIVVIIIIVVVALMMMMMMMMMMFSCFWAHSLCAQLRKHTKPRRSGGLARETQQVKAAHGTGPANNNTTTVACFFLFWTTIENLYNNEVLLWKCFYFQLIFNRTADKFNRWNHFPPLRCSCRYYFLSYFSCSRASCSWSATLKSASISCPV